MKLLLLLTILSFQLSLATETKEDAAKVQKTPEQLAQERWDKLMVLIKEEERSIERVTNKNSHLLYRLFELKTEKVKLYKEQENKKFIALKMQKGSKVSRQSVFTNTLANYEEVKELGLSILKKYPSTQHKAEIYYTLGLNSRDFAYDNKEKTYLTLALDNAPKYSQIEFLAKTSLAEYYYNNKSYPRAVSLYQDVIKNTQDEWYTKNLYNYGWCLVKTKKFEQAIALLEKSYHLSKNPNYINFGEQALHSLITFYAISDKSEDGEKFILQNEQDPFPHLFKLMKKVADRGYYEKAAQMIDRLVTMIPKAQVADVIDLKVYQIMFYKKYKEDNKLIEVARSLAQYQLDSNVKTEILEHMQQRVGIHQLSIKKDFTKYSYTYNVNTLAMIEDYFETLSLLDRDNTSSYKYYMAETYFAIHTFDQALITYAKSFESYIPEKTAKDFRQKSLKAMMNAVPSAKLSKSEEQEQIEYIYSNYLRNWPKDELSQKIFAKYFYLKMEKKNLEEAHNTIISYAESFPSDLKLQKELFNQMMDYYIEKKDTLKLAENIKLMAKGFLQFQSGDVKKAEVILANILFTNYQKMAQSGDGKKAVEGFKSIYLNKNYPQIILADAAFNAGITYTNLNEASDALKWYEKSFEYYDKNQKTKKKDDLVKLSARMYLLQDFINSAKLSNFVLAQFCGEKSEQNTSIFYQSIRSELANDYVSKALHTYESLANCTDGKLAQLEKDLIQHFYVFNHNKTMRSFVLLKGMKEKHNDLAVHYLKKQFWNNYLEGDRKAFFILKDLANFNCGDCQSLKKKIDKLESFQTSVKRYFYTKVSTGEKFNSDMFNKQLENRLIKAKSLIDEGNALLEYKDPNITILTLRTLYETTSKIEGELLELDIVGEDPNFRTSFKQQMQSLAKNFNDQSHKFLKLTYKVMEESDVYQGHSLPNTHGVPILEMADIRTPASEVVATIDIIQESK